MKKIIKFGLAVLISSSLFNLSTSSYASKGLSNAKIDRMVKVFNRADKYVLLNKEGQYVLSPKANKHFTTKELKMVKDQINDSNKRLEEIYKKRNKSTQIKINRHKKVVEIGPKAKTNYHSGVNKVVKHPKYETIYLNKTTANKLKYASVSKAQQYLKSITLPIKSNKNGIRSIDKVLKSNSIKGGLWIKLDNHGNGKTSWDWQ